MKFSELLNSQGMLTLQLKKIAAGYQIEVLEQILQHEFCYRLVSISLEERCVILASSFTKSDFFMRIIRLSKARPIGLLLFDPKLKIVRQLQVAKVDEAQIKAVDKKLYRLYQGKKTHDVEFPALYLRSSTFTHRKEKLLLHELILPSLNFFVNRFANS